VTVKHKVISLPRLDRLSPTLESTALKLMEEAGELAQAIGKLRGLSGEECSEDARTVMERVTRELLDVAQTAVSMMFVLEEHYSINIEAALEQHMRKLVAKGYLSMGKE
jgi:NTP pyrophosphatase (non-canonical NTP hydrolase)